jgi:hypothetical protein
MITVIIATATTVTEPRSPLTRLRRGNSVSRDGDTRQERRTRRDRDDDVITVATKMNDRTLRRDGPGGAGSVIAPRRQPCRLPGRIDAADLHRHRGEARRTHQQHNDKACDPERRLDRGAADLTA